MDGRRTEARSVSSGQIFFNGRCCGRSQTEARPRWLCPKNEKYERGGKINNLVAVTDLCNKNTTTKFFWIIPSRQLDVSEWIRYVNYMSLNEFVTAFICFPTKSVSSLRLFSHDLFVSLCWGLQECDFDISKSRILFGRGIRFWDPKLDQFGRPGAKDCTGGRRLQFVC